MLAQDIFQRTVKFSKSKLIFHGLTYTLEKIDLITIKTKLLFQSSANYF